MRALLDVSVLIALIDFNHIFHLKAHEWWGRNHGNGWASCPLTENGVVRIMANPGYSAMERFSIREVVAWLTEYAKISDHEFWPDQISLLDADKFDVERVFGPRQLTDAYLLALAVENAGRLVTLDANIPTAAATRASSANLVVIN